MFKSQIVADSKNEFGNRLTTFVVTFPRIILAEFNTHRMLSKNSASSRAIPFEKMVEAVRTNPFIPIGWMKDHKGMQGNEFITDKNYEHKRPFWIENTWLNARDQAITYAEAISEAGVTKQVVNRLLEPFMWHTVIVTGTEWDNFFGLRCHDAAEIHMQKIAYMMLDEYNKSTPKLLKAGEWHIPFESEIDENLLMTLGKFEQEHKDLITRLKVKISTVMAARTSYTVVGEDQKPMAYSKMIELHDKMKSADPKHMSPFEHCAPAMSKFEYDGSGIFRQELDGAGYTTQIQNGWPGNFRGFKQYRKMIENENIQNDPRVLKK